MTPPGRSHVRRTVRRAARRTGYPGNENPTGEGEARLWAGPGGAEAIAATVEDVSCERKVNLVGLGTVTDTACQKHTATWLALAAALS
ncbi:hypothetical protein [Streptomyces sp. NPDC126499]|uniref:hypothetical protein n=1 Tax=Streptomyces sp. NPDC126499 TaxID=3155314 RepID=UPI003321787D